MPLFAALFLVAFPAPLSDDESTEAPTAAEIREAIEATVDFLLETQESYEPDRPVGRLTDGELEKWQAKERKRLGRVFRDGRGEEWPYEGVYRVKRAIPSGYRIGGTAIVCDALLRSGAEGRRADRMREAVERSVDFVLEKLEGDPALAAGPKSGYDVRGWGHTYALALFLTLLELEAVDGKERERIEAAIPDLIQRLGANVTSMGGWNYANDRAVSPFMTGATLLALFDASARGYAVDPEMIEDAIAALEAGRTEVASYAYSGAAGRAIAMSGSAARSACAELALYKAGRSDADGLRRAVEGFFEGYEDLLVRKSQQGTHEGDYGIAPYYFFFGHAYVALAIEELPEKERAARRGELARLLWTTRDEDGSWNDRVFPRSASYSTAMVVQSLGAATRTRFASWAPDAPPKGK